MQKFISVFLVLIGLMLISVNSNAATVSCNAIASTEYVPSKGYVDIGADSVSRYVIQHMYWRTASRLSWFKSESTSTYEPDAIFYNYDGSAYGNAPIGYWTSDLPSPYVDTQAFDSASEKAVTIGSANAYFINAGRFYMTVTRMTAGGGNSSLVKLSSQRGRRVPGGCYSTNCSFGCSSNSNYFTVPFQSGYTAPSGRVYWWQDPNTTNQPW